MFYRIPSEQSSIDEGNKTHNTSIEGRGNKHWTVLICCNLICAHAIVIQRCYYGIIAFSNTYHFVVIFLLAKLFMLLMLFQVAAFILMEMFFRNWSTVAVKFVGFWIWNPCLNLGYLLTVSIVYFAYVVYLLFLSTIFMDGNLLIIVINPR